MNPACNAVVGTLESCCVQETARPTAKQEADNVVLAQRGNALQPAAAV